MKINVARNNVISCRVSDDELAQIDMWCRSLDKSRSNILFEMVFGKARNKYERETADV